MGKSRLIRTAFVAALIGALATPQETTVYRSLFDNPAAMEIPPEKSLGDLSSAEADFRG